MEISIQYIKNKILKLFDINDDLYLISQYPLEYIKYKQLSQKNNVSFENEIVKTYNTAELSYKYTCEIIDIINKEFKINIEYKHTTINRICEIIYRDIK